MSTAVDARSDTRRTKPPRRISGRGVAVHVTILALGVAAYLAMTQLTGDRGLVAVLIVAWAIALIGLNVVQGLGGYPSVAQAAFFGIGAYVSSVLLNSGMSMTLAAVVAVLSGTAVGLVVAVVFSRTRGQYFAIGTLFFAAVCTLVLTNESGFTGGPNGLPVDLGWSVDTTLGLLAASLALGLIAFHHLGRSELGTRLRSVREDEDLAEHLGVPTARIKLVAMVISAAIGSWAGVLLAQFNGAISPTQFTFVQGFLMFVAIGVGGYGRLFTPVIGAAVVVGLNQFLKLQPGVSQIVLGVIFILVTLAMPGGVIGTVEVLWARAVRRFSS